MVRGVIEGNSEVSVTAFNEDTDISMQDVVIRDTMSRATDGMMGSGLRVQDGAHATVSRAVFEANRDMGAGAFGAATGLVLVDVVIRDNQGQELDGELGVGVFVDDATVLVTRGVFERNRASGVVAYGGAGTDIEMVDIVILDTQEQDTDEPGGRGLHSEAAGGQINVLRALIARNHYCGVSSHGPDATLILEDVTVLGTQSSTNYSTGGVGLAVTSGASCTVTRASFVGNRTVGVYARDVGSRLLMTDVEVLSTYSQESDGMHGNGLLATTGAQVEVNRGLFFQNRSTGILSDEEGTLIVLSDVTVSETMERACVDDTCAGRGAGSGIGSYSGSHMDVTRFLVTANAQCGVQLAHGADLAHMRHPLGGTIDLHHGVVSGNPVGVNVQTEEFDLDRLMDHVAYFDNGTNLDMDILPVPELGVDL
jgi:hypothetical protein